MPLTQKIVDTLPSDRDGTTWDDDVKGLGLRVQAGNRTWIVRYRVSGLAVFGKVSRRMP